MFRWCRLDRAGSAIYEGRNITMGQRIIRLASSASDRLRRSPRRLLSAGAFHTRTANTVSTGRFGENGGANSLPPAGPRTARWHVPSPPVGRWSKASKQQTIAHGPRTATGYSLSWIAP